MSTAAQQSPALATTVERRFYPRIVPQAFIFVAFHENDPAGSLLLNVSENGLLLSTPTDLTINSVARLSVALNGLPKPVPVTVRVVWASETTKLAGMQFLNLGEHGRQQIRKWGILESRRAWQPESNHPLVLVPTSSTPPDKARNTRAFVEIPTFRPTNDALPLAPAITVRTRSISIAERCVIWGLYLATACLASAFFLRNETLGNLLSHSLANRSQRSSVASTPPNSERTVENPNISEQVAASAPVSPASILSAAKPQGAPRSASAPKDSVQKHKALADDDRVAPATPAAQTQHDDSPTASISRRQPASEISRVPALAGPTAENPPDAQNDLSTTAAISSPIDAATHQSSTPAKSPVSSVRADATSGAPPVTHNATTTKQPLPSAMRRDDTPATSASISASSPTDPIVVPTQSAFSSKPATPVIRMDPPRNQTLEVRLPGGRPLSFLRLPGERVLESPLATMRIQRSVFMPATHSGWPFNRNKKVVVGELISRVDPQPSQLPSSPATSVRLRATVAKDGRIENVKLVLGPANLVPAVAKALYEWRYQPTLVDDKPVETQCDVVFQFHGPSYHTARR
jgi:hypothetical protein